MNGADGFVQITAIFYAVFHPTEGTKIVHQVPENAIASSQSESNESAIFNFDTVKNYIIPKPQLCNKLVSFKIDKFRVLGFPVNIEGSQYSRNSFNFNFGFVFPYHSDITPYELAIRRVGKMFRALEEQSLLLSKLDRDQIFLNKDSLVLDDLTRLRQTPGHANVQRISLSSIESLILQIYQDLNNYSECCIPIDLANSVDIKLFPILPPPVNLKAFQVPISTVKLQSLMDVNWDPTMVKILPFINGLNSVKKISELADADYLLTKKCIQHLMHYQCITMTDIFQFNNIYAPTNRIGNFLKSDSMAEECQAYVISASKTDDQSLPTTPGLSGVSSAVFGSSRESPSGSNSLGSYSRSDPHKSAGLSEMVQILSKATLFYLYRLLNQGQTIREWYIQHQKALKNVDVRRFINFGVVRGIIYRVHSYPVLHKLIKHSENGESVVTIIKSLSIEKPTVDASHARQRKVSGSFGERSLLKDSTNEANLRTAKNSRSVSFNYNVERLQPHSEIDSDEDLDVFLSDSEESDLGGESVSLHAEIEADAKEREDLTKLVKLLAGSQHFDLICSELNKLRHELITMLDKLGPYFVINS